MHTNKIQLSLIIPVFNRPDEVDELLESLTQQSNSNFEVVIVEDGSTIACDQQVKKFGQQLSIQYFVKPNSGPGQSRNYGAERATGDYFVYLDSDCVIPPDYVQVVISTLEVNQIDAFGGPDRASEHFSPIQKAINYAMTSFFTTGGIRGGGEKLDKFYPRSFNMGYSKAVYKRTKGFADMRFGEDIDMSIRILKAGFKTRLIKDAWVYHKRRTNIRQFFKQVYNSGIARINLHLKHPGSMKMVHLLPGVFTIGVCGLLIFSLLFSPLWLLPLLCLALLFGIDSTIQNRSLKVGLMSVATSYIQLMGYGLGFLEAFFKRIILSKKSYSAFDKNFYE